MKTVTGVFDTYFEADTALTQLMAKGFSQSDISIVMSDTAKSRFTGSKNNNDNNNDNETVENNTVDGAEIGGVLGALVAGTAAITSFVIPGIGILAAGPVIAALAGAGAGASIGAVAGAFSDEGENDAKRYESYLKEGKALLIVHTKNDDQYNSAKTVLQNYGARTKAA